MKKITSILLLLSAMIFTGCEAPKAEISVSDTNISVGESVTFDASKSLDSDGDIVSYLWKNIEGTVLNKEMIFTQVFEEAGTEIITLLVTDDTGLSAEADVNITVNALVDENIAPDANFTVSSHTINVGETVIFDGSISIDSDGEIVSYRWSDGDDNTLSTEEIYTQTFVEDGTYTMTLTVTDNDGATDQYSIEIIVNAVAVCPEASLELINDDYQNDPVITYTITLDSVPETEVHIELSTDRYLDIWGQGWTKLNPTDPSELNVTIASGIEVVNGEVTLDVPFGDAVDEKGYVLRIESVTCD